MIKLIAWVLKFFGYKPVYVGKDYWTDTRENCMTQDEYLERGKRNESIHGDI